MPMTVTELAEGIGTVIAADSLGYIKANVVLANLVNRDYEDEVAEHGDTVKITKRGGLTVNDKAAGVAVTKQSPSLTAQSVVLDKHKEITFMVEDVAKALAKPEIIFGYIGDGLKVMSEQIDTDIAALYAGLSQTIDATAGMDEEDFRNGRRMLNAARVPMSDRWAVLHEDAEYEMLGIDKAIGADYAASLGQAVADSYAGRFYGFNTVLSQNIPVDTAVCKNLFMHKNALTLAFRPLPVTPAGFGVFQTVMVEDNLPLRVTMAYDKDSLAMQCTIDCLYGVAEFMDTYGIVVSTTEK